MSDESMFTERVFGMRRPPSPTPNMIVREYDTGRALRWTGTEWVDDIVTWVRWAFDDDEEAALAAGGSTSGRWARESYGCVIDAKRRLVVYGEGTPTREEADHIALHDPARVLREVEAKRKMLAPLEGILYQVQSKEEVISEEWDAGDPIDRTTSEGLLKLLALPYADRPGYREEWRP